MLCVRGGHKNKVMQNKNNLELDVREMFDVKKNDDAKRFEFNSKGDWISYTIPFTECEEDVHNAWISIYKALKHDLQLSPDNYVNAPIVP